MPKLSAANVVRLVDSVSSVLSQAYQQARMRLAAMSSPVLRMAVQRDHALSEVELLRREIAILRARLENIPSQRRPNYQPEQRLSILQLMRLRDWNCAGTAEHFVLHANTIRLWANAAAGNGPVHLFSGAVVWNRIDDAVRWAVHELRSVCPEPEFGTRTIARHLIRAGVKLSRSTVQRVLQEERPAKPTQPKRPPMQEPVGVECDNLLRSIVPGQVVHMDLIRVKMFWLCFTVAVILDGFSRKMLAVRAYAKTPCTRNLTTLVRRTCAVHGNPFLITDRGCQFQKEFTGEMKKAGIRHVKGRVRAPYLNGKIERCFRTFRIWWRLVLVGTSLRCIQRRLVDYCHWYNAHRPHSVHGVLTPDEAWRGDRPLEVIPIRAGDPQTFTIDVVRQRCRGDPRLPVIHIHVRQAA